MNKSKRLFNLLKEKRLIALLTPKNAEQCLKAYETLNPLDIILEIGFRSDSALVGIRAVLKKYPDALVFAGTIMTKTQAEKAIELGVAGVSIVASAFGIFKSHGLHPYNFDCSDVCNHFSETAP